MNWEIFLCGFVVLLPLMDHNINHHVVSCLDLQIILLFTLLILFGNPLHFSRRCLVVGDHCCPGYQMLATFSRTAHDRALHVLLGRTVIHQNVECAFVVDGGNCSWVVFDPSSYFQSHFVTHFAPCLCFGFVVLVVLGVGGG